MPLGDHGGTVLEQGRLGARVMHVHRHLAFGEVEVDTVGPALDARGNHSPMRIVRTPSCAWSWTAADTVLKKTTLRCSNTIIQMIADTRHGNDRATPPHALAGRLDRQGVVSVTALVGQRGGRDGSRSLSHTAYVTNVTVDRCTQRRRTPSCGSCRHHLLGAPLGDGAASSRSSRPSSSWASSKRSSTRYVQHRERRHRETSVNAIVPSILTSRRSLKTVPCWWSVCHHETEVHDRHVGRRDQRRDRAARAVHRRSRPFAATRGTRDRGRRGSPCSSAGRPTPTTCPRSAGPRTSRRRASGR